MRKRGPRLGELLEERGWVSREQLLRALRNQKVVGGKLGTCLLEIDAVSEETLLKALAEQQGVPAVTADELRGIPDEVLKLVPVKVARRLLAIPFRAGGASAQIAVPDARDLAALDELQFVSGRRVRVHVAPEVRLHEALEKHYSEECPPRFAKLLDRLNRSRFLWNQERPQSAPPAREELQWDPGLGVQVQRRPESSSFLGAFQPSPVPDLPGFEVEAPAPSPTPLPAEASVEIPIEVAAPSSPVGAIVVEVVEPSPPPLAATESPATPTAPPPPEAVFAAPPPAPEAVAPIAVELPPMTLAAAEQRLLGPEDRDDVARTLLAFAAGRARRTLLFKIHRDEVAGWMARGRDLEPTAIEGYRIKLDRPSVFLTLQSGAALFRGELADLPAHAPIAAALGGSAAPDALALPVRVRDRAVAVLYLEPEPGGFGAADIAELQHLTAKAAIAFELCIMRAKLRRA